MLLLLLSDSVATHVLVPNVVGLAQGDAITALQFVGLDVALSTQYNLGVPVGAVISQLPLAGTEVLAGSTVSLSIATHIASFTPATIRVRAIRTGFF